MDPFSKLPFPILVEIAKDIPDLASLYAVLCASPVFVDLLRGKGMAVEIVDTIISRKVPVCAQYVIRLAAMILANPPATWDDLLLRAKQSDRLTLPRALPFKPIRRLLALAAAVHGAAYRCAHVLLERCAALKPRRPADPKFHIRRSGCIFLITGGCKLMAPIPDMPVPVDPRAAPRMLTWVEEQRFLRGAWQLAVFSIVRQTVVTDIDVMKRPIAMWHKLGYSFYQYAFHISKYLETVADDDWPRRGEGKFSCSPYHGILRLADVAPESSISPYSCSFARGFDGNAEDYPTVRSRTMRFLTNCHSIHRSPLVNTSYKPFRLLGFYIWEPERLVALGCFGNDESLHTWFPNGYFREMSDMYTWRSLLTPAQVEELEERQREGYGKY